MPASSPALLNSVLDTVVRNFADNMMLGAIRFLQVRGVSNAEILAGQDELLVGLRAIAGAELELSLDAARALAAGGMDAWSPATLKVDAMAAGLAVGKAWLAARGAA